MEPQDSHSHSDLHSDSPSRPSIDRNSGSMSSRITFAIRSQVGYYWRSLNRSVDLSPEKFRNIFRYIFLTVPRLVVKFIGNVLYFILFKISKRVELLALFTCSLLVVTLIYIPLPDWIKITVGVLILFIASVGKTILDSKYGILESMLEESMLSNARKQFALGLPDTVPVNGIKNVGVTESLNADEKIIMVFKRHGIDVRFCDAKSGHSEDLLTFFSTVENPVISKDLMTEIKSILNLKNAPVQHCKGNLIYIHIYKTSG